MAVPHRPTVRVLQDDAGTVLKEPYEIDLSIKLSILISEIGEIKINDFEFDSDMPTIF
ncbi:hypothetical protein D3C86_1843790 [compost metagenome]